MVGVREHHLGPKVLEGAREHAFDTGFRAHRHEGRGFDGAVRRLYNASAGRSCSRVYPKGDGSHKDTVRPMFFLGKELGSLKRLDNILYSLYILPRVLHLLYPF